MYSKLIKFLNSIDLPKEKNILNQYGLYELYYKTDLTTTSIIKQQTINRVLYECMDELVSIFNKVKIDESHRTLPFVFLKGPLLGEMLYNPPEARTTSDIDLFIPLQYIPLAFDLLGKNGYQVNGVPLSKDMYELFINEDACKTLQHSHFRQATNRKCILEIHGTIFKYAPHITFNEHNLIAKSILEHSTTFAVNLCEYPYLDMTDLLLHISYHFCRHFIDNLHYNSCENKRSQEYEEIPFNKLHDVALLLNKFEKQIDYRLLIYRARLYHCLPAIYFAMKLIEEIYGIPIYQKLQEHVELLNLRSEDEEDEFFILASRYLTASFIFQNDGPEILYQIRSHLSPTRTYLLVPQLSDAIENEVTSKHGYYFLWRACLSSDNSRKKLILCWRIPTAFVKNRIQPTDIDVVYAQSIRDALEGQEELSPTVGFVLSSDNCRGDECPCAYNYELRLYQREFPHGKLYRIHALSDLPEAVDTYKYSCDIQMKNKMLTVKLILNDLDDFMMMHNDRIYFDISCDFAPYGNMARCFLSWSKQKFYRPVSCTYCGQFILSK